MAFVTVHSLWQVRPYLRHLAAPSSTSTRRSKTCIRFALSGPERDPRRPERLGERFEQQSTSWSFPPPDIQENDYHGWSSDFLQLCNAQLSLLMSTISNLAQAVIFFRHENPQTGALEFIPLMVHTTDTEDTPGRVWISTGAAEQTELEDAQTSKVLPGGIPAAWILPDYPFKPVGTEGGILMPDGGLCIPIEYNNVLAGSIVLMQKLTSHAHGQPWSAEDIRRADMVAKSIALGAALEGKWHANEGLLGTSRTMVQSVRSLLRTTLHQIRSPISALVTFGHLLLRKLPPGDTNRDLAKNMILEALRVDDLLEPLDDAGRKLVLPEATAQGGAWFDSGRSKSEASVRYAHEESGEVSGSEVRRELVGGIAGYAPSAEVVSSTTKGAKKLLWLGDVLGPQSDVYSVLSKEKGMVFVSDIDNDTPPVMAVEKYVREAVSNLMDNALKYSPPGSYIGIKCNVVQEDMSEALEPECFVEVVIWDTGYGFSPDEIDKVWDFGFRGSASRKSTSPGSGFGLAIVREMLESTGADISLQSPLPADLDPRDTNESPRTCGSAFCMRFKRHTG